MAEPVPFTRPASTEPALCTVPAAPSPLLRLEDLAARLSRTLALARALALAGRTLDLTGVDDGIGILCAQTLDLPTPDARRMVPQLHELVGQLDLLSLAVRGTARPGVPAC